MYIYATKNAIYSFKNKNDIDAFEMSIENYEKNKGNEWEKNKQYGIFETKEFEDSYSAFLDYASNTLKI